MALKLRSRLKALMQRILRRGPSEPQDPHAYVASPVRRGPSGRASAIALVEPEQPKFLKALGRRWPAKYGNR